MNVKSSILGLDLKFQWIGLLLTLLIFAGYSLRSVIPYNFESVFLFILILLVYLFIKEKVPKWPKDLVVLSGLLLAFCISIIVLNFLHSPLQDVSLQKIQITLLMIGFVALTWLLFLLKPPLDFFWYFLMGASLIMLVRFVLELSYFGLSGIQDMVRLGDAFGNPIQFGLFANTLFILMIGGIVWAYKRHPVMLLFWLLLLLVNFLMVVLSQTRTAWLGWGEALIGWGGYYFYLAYRHKLLLKFGAGLAFLMAILVWMNTVIPISNVFEKRVSLVFTNIEDYRTGENPLTSVGLRLSMYETAIDMIKEKPYIGYGSDGFSERFKERSRDFFQQEFNLEHPGLHFSHVHNQFLMTWLQYGVIPVLLLLFIFVFLIRYFWRGMRLVSEEDKPIFIGGLVFIGAMLVAFMVESPLEFTTYAAHYWLFTTLIFVLSLLVKKPLNKVP